MSFCEAETTKGGRCRKRQLSGGRYCYIHQKELERPTTLERIAARREPPKSSIQLSLPIPALGSIARLDEEELKVLDYIYEKEKVVGLMTDQGRFYASWIGWLSESKRLTTD